jgi:hypothetical protein
MPLLSGEAAIFFGIPRQGGRSTFHWQRDDPNIRVHIFVPREQRRTNVIVAAFDYP